MSGRFEAPSSSRMLVRRAAYCVKFGPLAFIFEYVGREMSCGDSVGQLGTRGYDGKPWMARPWNENWNEIA